MTLAALHNHHPLSALGQLETITLFYRQVPCSSQGGATIFSPELTMRIIHFFLGSFILFIDWLTTPKSIQRPADMQKSVDESCGSLTLYQYKACPFSVKVRRSLKRLSLPVELRDPKRCATAKEELVAGAGKLKCPCLKIEDGEGEARWMFDSKDIIGYLEGRFTEV